MAAMAVMGIGIGAEAGAEPGEGLARLPELCNRRLAEVLRRVDSVDLVWLREIREEAALMFGSRCSNEPELMPKTPSQKKRQRRKRPSNLREEGWEAGRKRLSRRKNSSLKVVSSTRRSQRFQNKENLEPAGAGVTQDSPPQRVTRSQAATAKRSEALPEMPPAQRVVGKILLVGVGASDRVSAELHLQKSAAKPAELPSTSILSLNDASPRESRAAASPPVTPKAADATFVLSEEPGCEVVGSSAPVQELPQHLRDSPRTPTSSRLSRRSVRRSLLGKTSVIHRTSLAEKYSLASKRESMIRKSIARTMAKRKAAQKLSVSAGHADAPSSGEVLEHEEAVSETKPSPGPCTPSKSSPQSPRMSLRSRTITQNDQPASSNESDTNKNEETLEPPQSARRKPSYKRAVDKCYDNQQAVDGGLSPLRRKTLSPVFPASKVVRPFKTFLHTVQKNQLLMTPSSVGRNGVIKSFIRYNTPVRSDPKEKERQKLETLRRKQEAEQLRKEKLEEEKKRRLEEAKLKREERLRKVLQARERAEQLEEERKKRIEQKIALFEKSEKVREERLAEEIKKKAAAKKREEAEARRRQEEEARKQRALQQEEEERRRRELMQKRKEEEQERARKIAEHRRAEQEREKRLAAERDLERKKEQERIQAEKLREQQEKSAHLQKEVLAKEQLQKETKKKEEEQQRLAELKRQEQKALSEEQKAKEREQHLESKENLPACTSYQMTPQAPKEPKPTMENPNNYGLDLNSDDSTDDESHPRKPIPAWASGNLLSQAVIRQYYNPPNIDELFGAIASPKLEDIFYKNKPRYFKRTSSAVWNSPPFPGTKMALGLPYGLKKH
ncbi:inner centromere protein [Cuculus canorus]|uniref:inner centromere protein n=1 Tax=Cuculus canorus TaxID=55661 RepID=UPI0023AADFDB|nr:inner centromere protein [Cuculus canorus]